ncbi:MAG: extracellular solute-binding protein [Propionibacteriaceae bacterium]|jgi:raffinose/stachyose/melibiose transport system substrate-binding protein|nr:extracellular solute-binding protein [Propionibacteriaceae bacterium]
MTPTRRTHRSHGLAAALVASSLLLSACSSGGTDDTTSEDTPAADGAVELVFDSWLPTMDPLQWPALYAAFQEENPDISITFNRDEDFDAFKTQLDNKILADEVPDIYGIQVGSSFDDYADYALDTSEYASGWIDQLSEQAVAQTTTTDGTVAAVPILNAGMEYFLYNQTLMDEMGLTLPTTRDEVFAIATQIRAAGLTPFAMGAADAWHDADFFVWLSNQYGSGGDIYKAAAGEIPWDSDTLVQAGQAWQELFTNGVFEDAATTVNTYPMARDDYFMARRAVFMPTGSWHVGAGLTISPETPGTAVENDALGMADCPPGGERDAGVTAGVDFALAISASSTPEKQEAAAKFVEFMAVGEGQQMWADTLQGFPVAKDVTVHLDEGESDLAQSSVDLVTETLLAAQYDRKLVSPGRDSLENDLGVVLQNIADGADPATELATLNQ